MPVGCRQALLLRAGRATAGDGCTAVSTIAAAGDQGGGAAQIDEIKPFRANISLSSVAAGLTAGL